MVYAELNGAEPTIRSSMGQTPRIQRGVPPHLSRLTCSRSCVLGRTSPVRRRRGGDAAMKIGIVGRIRRGLYGGQRHPEASSVTVDRRVEIYIIDEVEVGCGRIFRTDQPGVVLRHNALGHILLFSGGPDGARLAPGRGRRPSRSGGRPWTAATGARATEPARPVSPVRLGGHRGGDYPRRDDCGASKYVDLEPAVGGYRRLADGGHLNVDRRGDWPRQAVMAQGNEHGPDNFTAGDPGPMHVPG